MNYTASSSDTVQQNKIWANMAVSQKAAKKNLKIQRMVKAIITFRLPSASLKPWSIEYVNDVHRGISGKNCSRDETGQFETQVHLQSLEQKLQPNKEWSAFFHNISLIHL